MTVELNEVQQLDKLWAFIARTLGICEEDEQAFLSGELSVDDLCKRIRERG